MQATLHLYIIYHIDSNISDKSLTYFDNCVPCLQCFAVLSIIMYYSIDLLIFGRITHLRHVCALSLYITYSPDCELGESYLHTRHVHVNWYTENVLHSHTGRI